MERLDAEVTAQRAVWDEDTRKCERKEQEDDLKQQRQRDIEDYEYRKNLERKKAQGKYSRSCVREGSPIGGR